jgi:hypothetical protein
MRSSNILKPALTLAIALGIAVTAAQTPSQLTWRLDNLERAGADPFQIIGAPSIVDTDLGRAVQFNGMSDGLVIGRNPIAGLRQFTIEVLLSPDTDGPEEQRFPTSRTLTARIAPSSSCGWPTAAGASIRICATTRRS